MSKYGAVQSQFSFYYQKIFGIETRGNFRDIRLSEFLIFSLVDFSDFCLYIARFEKSTIRLYNLVVLAF